MTDITNKIEAWIEKGGFPLEMKVANAFIKAGFDVTQSVYFKDSESEKYRETDIIATSGKIINGLLINLTIVIECKKSTEKPWIILINDGLKHYDELLPIYITKNGEYFIQKVSNQNDFKSDLIFKNSREIGYSIVTAFNSGKDTSYEAIQSLTKACEYFQQECSKKRRNQCNLYFPVVIVDGLIFNATLTEEEEMKIEKVQNSEVFMTRSFHSSGNASVSIYDSTELTKTAEKIFSQCEEMFENYQEFF